MPDNKPTNLYYRIVRVVATKALRIISVKDDDLHLLHVFKLYCPERFDTLQEAREFAFLNIEEPVETQRERWANGLSDSTSPGPAPPDAEPRAWRTGPIRPSERFNKPPGG